MPVQAAENEEMGRTGEQGDDEKINDEQNNDKQNNDEQL